MQQGQGVIAFLQPVHHQDTVEQGVGQGQGRLVRQAGEVARAGGPGFHPLPNALFDRILVVHGLEESDDPLALLQEVWRVLGPSGRGVIAAASRLGLWSDAEKTPFGRGRPYTRTQLEELVREAELEPMAWSRALYVPPAAALARWAEGFEQIGSRLCPSVSGIILLEAVKQTFAVKPRAPRLRARAGAFKPATAGPLLDSSRSGLEPRGFALS